MVVLVGVPAQNSKRNFLQPIHLISEEFVPDVLVAVAAQLYQVACIASRHARPRELDRALDWRGRSGTAEPGGCHRFHKSESVPILRITPLAPSRITFRVLRPRPNCVLPSRNDPWKLLRRDRQRVDRLASVGHRAVAAHVDLVDLARGHVPHLDLVVKDSYAVIVGFYPRN